MAIYEEGTMNPEPFFKKNEPLACPVERGVSNLERENAQLKAIIKLIDKTVPMADDTCDEPGITFSEACRRQLIEDKHPIFAEGC